MDRSRTPSTRDVIESARLGGSEEEPMLLVTVRPARPSEELRIRVQCEGRGLTMRFPLGSFWPDMSKANIQIPVGGGTERARGTYQGVRYDFVFTLRNEARP